MANNIISGCKSHHIALFATDYEKTVNMYKGIGFSETLIFKDGTFLDAGDGFTIEVFKGNTSFPVGGWLHFALEVDDVEDSLQKALAAGFTLCDNIRIATISSTPPKDVKIAFVRGNDGEVVEFMHFM